MSVKPHQHAHLANGILRIRQAIKNCDLPVSEVGTVFTPRIRFKHVFIKPLMQSLIESDKVFNDACKYLKSIGLK